MNFTPEKIKEMINAPEIKVEVDTLEEDIPLKDQGVDSLGLMTIVLCIEENLNIKIPDADVDGFITLNDIVNYLNQ